MLVMLSVDCLIVLSVICMSPICLIVLFWVMGVFFMVLAILLMSFVSHLPILISLLPIHFLIVVLCFICGLPFVGDGLVCCVWWGFSPPVVGLESVF